MLHHLVYNFNLEGNLKTKLQKIKIKANKYLKNKKKYVMIECSQVI